jgi:hypothetical protein
MSGRPEAFFIVWNPEGTNPQFRHESFSMAAREAERLTMMNPGKHFFVMQAHRRVSTAKPIEIEDFDTDLEIPF